MALTPYSGPWTQVEAAHLLRRTLFGPTFQQINDAVGLGLSNTVTQLLTVPSFTQPLSFLPEETIVPFGFPWPFSNYPSDTTLAQYHETARLDSLTAWLHERINHESFSLHEKMCLFWHNHFGAKTGPDARASFDYFRLIQNHAFGNFKNFVQEMTINPNMLIFLNGAENSVVSPNENFARELLELYTIGKGPLIAPGDYTNYTELDIQEIAKIMTGWKVNGILSDVDYYVTASFNASDHNTTTKTLSYHFNNASIVNNNELEYLDLLEIIFQQDEVAAYICRKLYRWFVNFDITDIIENDVIQALKQTFLANNFDIMPVLSELLNSEHFFDTALRGTIVKNPLEFMYSVFNATGSINANSLNAKYRIFLKMQGTSLLMNQNIVHPPSVAGWPSYYQAPDYSHLWVNASLVKLRFDFIEFISVFDGYEESGTFFKINTLDFLNNLSNPSDVNQVIDDCILIFLTKGFEQSKKENLKTILTNSLPDFEWTVQYNDYANDPGNTLLSDPLENRMNLGLAFLLNSPEFQVF